MLPIFKYEERDGIAKLVKSSGSIVIANKAMVVDTTDDQRAAIADILKSNAKANPDQFDLFYMESILASVGWNGNDDVFDHNEMWKARYTPVDKQFNYMHDEADIIGHLTSSKVVDFNGGIIDDDIEIVPEIFDIVVGSVLYKRWSDNKLQERIDKIIAEIQDEKWFVSMECLFSNFDYAIITPDNKHKVVARDDKTSFLTKHLRVYGGTGEYDGNKVGRLLRGFTFSGKGLVDNPANSRSHITNTNNSSEVTSFACAEDLYISNKEISMADDKEYSMLQTRHDALKDELEKIKASNIEATEKAVEKLTANVKEFEEANNKLMSELEASKEVAKAKDDNIEALSTDLKDTKSKVEELEQKIEEGELETLKSERKIRLLEKVDDTRADELVEKFANVNNDIFDTLVESLPAKKVSDDKEDKDMKKKKKDAKADDSIDTDLDDANASNDADMTSGGNNDDTADLCASASNWLLNNVLRSTAGKKQEGEE